MSSTDAAFVVQFIMHLDSNTFPDTNSISNDIVEPAWNAMPAFFKANQYQTPTDPLGSSLQYAFKSKIHFFDLLAERDMMSTFQAFIGDYRADRAELLDIFPVEEQLIKGFDASTPDAVLLVDVGGGRGHEILKLLDKFPDVKGRMVLQDLPHVVDDVRSESMETMAYDFFTPQPIQGT